MKALYRITVHNPPATPPPSPWRRVHSWVKQFVQIMRVHWAYEDDNAVRNTANALVQVARSSLNQEMSLVCAAGSDIYGLQVGSNAGAESPQDYKLGVLIDDGIAGGELQYGACTVSAVTIDGDDQYVDVSRTFTNGSGGVVTVREVGLVAMASPSFFLIIRDVLDDPLNVPHGGILTLTYRLQVTN